MAETSRYQRDIETVLVNDSVAYAVAAVPPGARVLDIGAADGSVAAALGRTGCRVTGVEYDPETAEAAAAVCERIVVGDVEEMDLAGELDGPYDAVLLLDVLEHLVDPVSVLRRIHPLLAPDGWLVLSVPNAAHAGLRLALLENRFDYADLGLLDRTHLRFFDHDGFVQLLADGGWTVLDETAVWREPTETEQGGSEILGRLPQIAEILERDPHACTYQFLARAVPEGSPLLADPPYLAAMAYREVASARERQLRRTERALLGAQAELAHLRTVAG